jgi:hypothetical protein
MEQHRGADADRDAVDGGDDRLDVVRQRVKEFDRIGGARHIGIGGAVFEEILEIVAGGEHARTAGDDDAADVRVVLRLVDGVAHGAIHVLRDRVLLLGPPQRDHARRIFVRHNEVPGHELVPAKQAATMPLANHPLHPT